MLIRKVHKKHRIIASLTSYPPRIGTVHMAIQSLLAQKCLPDLVVLWLYRGDFPNGEADIYHGNCGASFLLMFKLSGLIMI